MFVTGRHLASVQESIRQHELPNPEWIICDVGTSIYQVNRQGEPELLQEYHQHQSSIIAQSPIQALRGRLVQIDGLCPQEDEKQGPYKLSFYTTRDDLPRLVKLVQSELDRMAAPYTIIHSYDPFDGSGLVDLLPAGISKAYALQWWEQQAVSGSHRIVFAGDSGNDLAALTAGHQAIVVGNAEHKIIQAAYQQHREQGWRDRLYLAAGSATSGVLEGAYWFEVFETPGPSRIRLGATPLTYNRTQFRVWAPRRQRLAVEIERDGEWESHELEKDEEGYFFGIVHGVAAHDRYRYCLDGSLRRPDPVTRFQPEGVHGPSQVVQVQDFPWTDDAWTGIARQDLIVYELHLGAFTREGTYGAAIERLPELVELGVTAIELMPLAQSPGGWNWGYDGVNLFAPRSTYGTPEDLRAFVDACHRVGLAVILDVVYNHLGPEGNYLSDFGPYFSARHKTPWGEAFNFDGRDRRAVRRYVVDNAIEWLRDYHLDGLRLDAVHFMFDESVPHILAEIRNAVSEFATGCRREVHLIAEANVFDAQLVGPQAEDRYDAAWCDCFMHSVYTLALPDLQLSHRDYSGSSDLEEVLEHGYLYEYRDGVAKRVTSSNRPRRDQGSPIPSFLTSLQTHDGVGNHPHGKRLHQLTSKSYQRAAAALALLFPATPLLFMGEESASESHFPFFADFEDEALRKAVDEGRAREYPQHVWEGAVLPSDPAAFYDSKCYERCDPEMFAWYQELIRLRKRGKKESWLCHTNMESWSDQDRGLFALRYRRGPTEHLVLARLTGKATGEPLDYLHDGELLASSESVEISQAGIRLHPNHAVVLRHG